MICSLDFTMGLDGRKIQAIIVICLSGYVLTDEWVHLLRDVMSYARHIYDYVICKTPA